MTPTTDLTQFAPVQTVPTASLAVLVAMLVTAVFYDLRERRIPQWATFPSIGLGLLLAALNGPAGFRSSVIGFVIGFGFLFIFYLFKGMGGGDVALMGAVGALIGHSQVQIALVYTSILGAALALLMILWTPAARPGLGGLVRALAFWKAKPAATETAGAAATTAAVATAAPAIQVPYAVAIAAGALLCVWLNPVR